MAPSRSPRTVTVDVFTRGMIRSFLYCCVLYFSVHTGQVLGYSTALRPKNLSFEEKKLNESYLNIVLRPSRWDRLSMLLLLFMRFSVVYGGGVAGVHLVVSIRSSPPPQQTFFTVPHLGTAFSSHSQSTLLWTPRCAALYAHICSPRDAALAPPMTRFLC